MTRMHVIAAAAGGLLWTFPALADQSYDADLYQRAYDALQSRQYEVALPLLVEFQGVCFKYTDKHPRLCQQVSKAIGDIENAIEQQKQAGSDYYANGGDNSKLLARVDPPPSGGF